MEVLKQTSPQACARAPKPRPRNTEPSSRAKIASITAIKNQEPRLKKEKTKSAKRNFAFLERALRLGRMLSEGVQRHYRGQCGQDYQQRKRGIPERAIPWVARV